MKHFLEISFGINIEERNQNGIKKELELGKDSVKARVMCESLRPTSELDLHLEPTTTFDRISMLVGREFPERRLTEHSSAARV